MQLNVGMVDSFNETSWVAVISWSAWTKTETLILKSTFSRVALGELKRREVRNVGRTNEPYKIKFQRRCKHIF